MKSKEKLKTLHITYQMLSDANNSKGITLVTLVITIIILLILSGATITTMVGDDGIINNMRKSESEVNAEQNETVQEIQNAENSLSDKLIPDPWVQKNDGTIKKGDITIKIGDYINYDCKTEDTYTSAVAKNGYRDQTFKASNYTYGWRVLGVDEKGQLLIISEDLVPLTGGTTDGASGRTYYFLVNQEASINAIDELNKICEIYGRGFGAICARSVTIDDVNKITGYNPDNPANGAVAKYKEGTILEYGNIVSYYWRGTDLPYYLTSNGLSGELNYHHSTGFWLYDEKTKTWKNIGVSTTATTTNMEYIATLKNTYYEYNPTTYTESSTGEILGLEPTSLEYKLLFTNSSTGKDKANAGKTTNFNYWIASPMVDVNYMEKADWGIRLVHDGFVRGYGFYTSAKEYGGESHGVRPVVSLKSDITVEKATEQKDGCNVWNIK